MDRLVLEGDIKEGDGSTQFRLGIKKPDDPFSPPVWIATRIGSIEQLEELVRTLIGELEEVKAEGEKILADLQKQRAKESEMIKPGMAPSSIWDILNQMEGEEFFRMFNNLPENDRKDVADYVFTSLNVFKGKAMFFSQHYDYGSGLLVE